MITYVNNSNANSYSVLWENANQALIKATIADSNIGFEYEKDGNKPKKNEAGLYVAVDPITSLEQYFKWLPTLVDIGSGSDLDGKLYRGYQNLHSEGRRYTMLPLKTEDQSIIYGEEFFEIDANSRLITVPTNFKSNGIAVQGDELAEVIYFRVDRFFDATDLDTCEIFIQWENGSDSGISRPWVIDAESESGKIIFGWALSSDITKNRGTLKFLVRFIQRNGSDIRYSWSTLTQTAVVKEALQLVITDDVLAQMADTAIDDSIRARITGSHTQLTGIDMAKAPVYVINLTEFADLDDNAEYDESLAADESVHNNFKKYKETKALEVEASSVDGGSISYIWKYTDKDGVAQDSVNCGASGDISDCEVKIEFRATTDTAAEAKNGKKLYFEEAVVEDPITHQKVTVYNSISVATLDEEALQNKINAGKVLEKIAVCIVNRVGTYVATATNRKSSTNDSSLKSVACVVPMPSEPVIDNTSLENDSKILGNFVADEDHETGSVVSLKVNVTNEEENGTRKGILSYKWFFKNEEADSWGGPIDTGTLASDATEIIYAVTNTQEALANHKLVEGFYKVEVNNHKNGADVIKDSVVCRVSYAPEEPVIKYPVKRETDPGSNLNEVYYLIDDAWAAKWNITDGFTYQWFLSVNDTFDDNEDTPVTDVLTQSKNNLTIACPVANITRTGRYYCKIGNIKNGEVKTKAFFSNYFTIMNV